MSRCNSKTFFSSAETLGSWAGQNLEGDQSARENFAGKQAYYYDTHLSLMFSPSCFLRARNTGFKASSSSSRFLTLKGEITFMVSSYWHSKGAQPVRKATLLALKLTVWYHYSGRKSVERITGKQREKRTHNISVKVRSTRIKIMVRLLHGHIPLIRDIPIPRQAGRQMTIILPSGYYELSLYFRMDLNQDKLEVTSKQVQGSTFLAERKKIENKNKKIDNKNKIK